jgi:hypothetical protein
LTYFSSEFVAHPSHSVEFQNDDKTILQIIVNNLAGEQLPYQPGEPRVA